jgi:hypothetical protein
MHLALTATTVKASPESHSFASFIYFSSAIICNVLAIFCKSSETPFQLYIIVSSRLKLARMSAKLLKRLLQDTGGEDQAESVLKAAHEKRKKANKRRKLDFSPPADHDQVLQQQVEGMLFLDEKMVSSSSKVEKTLQRLTRKQDKESRIRKKSVGMVVGNSRDAASKTRLKKEPTFNKKTHKVQKESKKLRTIARLLKKNSSKS